MIPDNAIWYHLTYAIVAVMYGGYAASLWWRRRWLRKNKG